MHQEYAHLGLDDQPKWRFLAWFDSIGTIAVAVGAVVALAGGIVSFIYLVLPDPSQPPPARNATMKITDNFSRSLRDFLIETGQDLSGYTEAELEQLGREYYISITVEGLRNKSPEIVWNLQDINDLPSSERKHWIHQSLASFEPPVDTYTRTAKVWIQYPPFRGTFYAVIEVEYPNFETLGSPIHTKRFTGRLRQPREGPGPVTTTRMLTTVTTIPARETTAVETIEGTTTALTTINNTSTEVTTTDGTTITGTTMVPTTSNVTIRTTRTTIITKTIPARTSTVTRATTQTVVATAPHVPIVRPTAKITPP